MRTRSFSNKSSVATLPSLRSATAPPSQSAGDAFDEQRSLHLAGGGGARQGLDQLEPPRPLEAGEPPLAMGAQRIEARSPARRGHDHRAHELAPLRVGDPDDRELLDARGVRERGLDLGGRDALAAA